MPRAATDQITALNEDLNVVYSRWTNGSQFRRLIPLWTGLHLNEFVPPSANITVARLAANGVEWVLAEHVSITVSGTVRYAYDTAEGVIQDIGTAGCHNVENGGGYLPVNPFTRWCDDDHVSCCVLSNPQGKSDTRYSFEIASEADLKAAISHEVQGLKATFIIGRLRA